MQPVRLPQRGAGGAVKLCLEPDCWNVTAGSRCADCERARQRARNADPARKPRRTRAYMDTVIPVGAACWCCGSTADLTRHHVTPLALMDAVREDGSPAFFDPAGSLVPMCRSCNSSIGARVMAGFACPQHGGVVLDG